MTSKLQGIVAALRERTWLSPVPAEEMNQRDKFLADAIEAALVVEPGGAEPPQDVARAGFVDGVLYCYGGCGRRYTDFGLDNSLPTELWNRIAVGAPFDETQTGIDREGRGGVLCANCVVERLHKLPGVTVAFIETDTEPVEIRFTTRLLGSLRETAAGALKSFVNDHGVSLEGGNLASASKRVAHSLFGLLKTHPDIRKSRQRWHDPACEAECHAKAARINELEAALRTSAVSDKSQQASDDGLPAAVRSGRQPSAPNGEDSGILEASGAGAAGGSVLLVLFT